jgi:hypothetical protein
VKSGHSGRKSTEFPKGLLTSGWLTHRAIAGVDAAETNPAINAAIVIRLAKVAISS